MKKLLAIAEIIISVTIIVFSVSEYSKVRSIGVGKLLDSVIATSDAGITAVNNCKETYKLACKTIPQHKKTLLSVCEKIDGLRVSCETVKDKIPNWNYDWCKKLKSIPGNLYQPFGEAKKSMAEIIAVLDSYDYQKQQDSIDAFDKIINSLGDAKNACMQSRIHADSIIKMFLFLFIFTGICFFLNGIMVFIPEKHDNNP